MLGISGWLGLGLAFYSVAITLLTFWLAARLWGRGQTTKIWSPRAIAGNLVWAALLFLASVIAARYVERLDSAFLGYMSYALVSFLLSLVQARLHLRVMQSRVAEGRLQRARPSRADLVHNLTYLLLALVLFLFVSWLAGPPANPFLLIPLFLGALLPDLDSPDSLVGRLLPSISRRLAAWLRSGQAWHTPAAGFLVAILTSPLALIVHDGLAVSSTLFLGFAAHLLLDLLHPEGIMLLWPLSPNRYHLPGAPLQTYGGTLERRISAGLAAVGLVLLLAVGLGPEPPPIPAPAPSYEQTLDRYHELRGRYLVFASVQGTWQTSGLRLSGRFEVLGAPGNSYVLLDRFTDKIFTAGHTASDHVYLDSISLQAGSQVQIKPTEILLEDQPLASGLTVLYEMQREPGLVHIYAFGHLVVPGDLHDDRPELREEQGLTSLSRVEAEESGHYRLQYLTAADLIALASTEVETAELLVVATYSSPPAGPTPTPLPPLPGTPEAAP
jgi:inner membrane protein